MVLEFVSNNMEFFVFVLVLTLFLLWKKKNLEIQGPFPIMYMLLYKTRLGLDKMSSWSKKHPNVFLYLSYFSIFIGIVGTIATFIFMFWQLHFIVANEITAGGGLVLPLKTEAGLDGALPVFYVPFWYWLIALFVLVIVHEFAHGVIAERFKVKIKSSGFAFGALLLPILPAAFVEPDLKSLEKKPWWQQIAVFGAGSSSNFIFGFLFLAIWIFGAGSLIDNTMQVGDIQFSGVLNESDLEQYGIESGSLIAIGDIKDNDLMIEYLRNLSVNQSVNLTIDNGENISSYLINTFENPQIKGKGMIGISGLEFNLINQEGYEYLGDTPLYLERLLFYIWFLNIGIGIMNLLPIWITDGGQILRTLLLKYVKKETTAYRIYNLVSFISLILIVFTLRPDYLISLISLF